jgi:hypothetical protein
MSFFAELKRRNVYKVAAAYAVVGWLIVQVATQVFPFLHRPDLISCQVVRVVGLLGEFIERRRVHRSKTLS